jgi:uncharacterized membrane protein
VFGVPLHFVIIHFPVVFLAAVLFCDLRGDHDAGYRFTIWGAATAALSVLTGLLQVGGQISEVPVHAGAGITGTFVLLILAMLKYSRRARGEEGFLKAWLLVEILAMLGIAVAVITGHRAVLGY